MRITVPGDKSLSHRTLILGALSREGAEVSGLLSAGDTQATAAALRALGAGVPTLPSDGAAVRINGVGRRGMSSPAQPIDCGNSGTTARLLLGVLAAQDVEAVITGDDSLRRRPMARVTEPLQRMGARFHWLEEEGRLPVRVKGGGLRGGEHRLEMASAQVKGALLLAGLVGGVPVSVVEPGPSRDHTERLLRMLGVSVTTNRAGESRAVHLGEAPAEVPGLQYTVPGDFSSAAFWLALAVLGGGAASTLRVEDVGLNPTRTGLLGVLERMGARVNAEVIEAGDAGEPRGALEASPSELQGVEVSGAEIPGLVDEVPLVAVLAARARGWTRITGAAELRIKESDRIRSLVTNLSALGVSVEERPDGLAVQGARGPLRGRVEAYGDHRIAMAFGVLGALPGHEIQVDTPGAVDVSYPGFWAALEDLSQAAGSGSVRKREGRSAPAGGAGAPTDSTSPEEEPTEALEGLIVTVDGPAASGKSSTARAVARHLGLPHLDSGTFYRAVTHALLTREIAEGAWEELTEEDLDALGVEISLDPREGVRVVLDGAEVAGELRRPEVTARVSHLAAIPRVRQWLLPRFRDAAAEVGAVADGRDLGTVVFPDAHVKIYLTAELEERARRRLLEEGRPADHDAVAAEAHRLQERDRRDSEREVAPLRRPEDAAVVDTTGLAFEEQVEAVVQRVRSLTAADSGR